MIKQNPNVKIQLFKEKKKSSQPITMTNVTKIEENGMLFFNSNRGSRVHDASAVQFMNTPVEELKLIDIKDEFSGTFTLKGTIKWLKEATDPNNNGKMVRDGMLADGTYNIPISVWGNTISEIEEGKYLQLTEVGAKYFHGQKLYTKQATKVIVLDDADPPHINWDELDLNPASVTPKKNPAPQLVSPEVLSLKLNFYPICAKCSKKITVLPGDDIVQCKDCMRSMLLENCKCSFDGQLQFEHNSSDITLTVFAETLEKYLQEDILIKYKDCPKELERKLLKMKNVTVTYNSKRIITAITDNKTEE